MNVQSLNSTAGRLARSWLSACTGSEASLRSFKALAATLVDQEREGVMATAVQAIAFSNPVDASHMGEDLLGVGEAMPDGSARLYFLPLLTVPDRSPDLDSLAGTLSMALRESGVGLLEVERSLVTAEAVRMLSPVGARTALLSMMGSGTSGLPSAGDGLPSLSVAAMPCLLRRTARTPMPSKAEMRSEEMAMRAWNATVRMQHGCVVAFPRPPSRVGEGLEWLEQVARPPADWLGTFEEAAQQTGLSLEGARYGVVEGEGLVAKIGEGDDAIMLRREVL